MQTRRLGNSDLELTVIGLGTWAIGGGGWNFGWGPQEDQDSIAAIRRALDVGVNWIDTAAVYGLGHAEKIVAQAIVGRREEVIIATKGGLVWDEGGTTPYGRLKAHSIRREVEASLRRLKLEAIDLYQIHWPTPPQDVEEAWSAVTDMIEEGKIRYGGVSNFKVEQLKRVQAIHPVTSLQPPYNMIERGIEHEVLAYCAANNIGVITYGPMRAGLLTGKLTRERIAGLPPNDWRGRNEDFQEPRLGTHLEFVESLRPIAAGNDRSLAELAIAWVLRRQEVTAAIVGARTPGQIEQTVEAATWQLSAEDLARIDEILESHTKSLKQLT
jgi:aryl-alcohol dehydrogenase-like predicted oxidoreductase